MADLFLNELGAESFAIAHCNFHLRGEESDGDEALVKAWADSNGVRMHRVDFDTVSYAREHGVSIEMAARDLRYGWFEQLCDESGYNVVVVAHNANDNAETLMLNLLRGTGLNGLHGMPQVQWRTAKCTIFRPMLECTRKQIEGYVLAHKVPYRNDSSNFESEYKRNRIRNEIFPVFEKINPSFVRTLNREIGYFAEAGSIVEDWCRSQLPKVIRHPERSEGSVTISIPSLLSTDHWRYLLYYILQQYGFNSQTIASVEGLLVSDRTISGKRFDSPTHTLRTERDKMLVLQNEAADQGVIPDLIGELCMPVRGTGIYNCNGVRWQVEELEWNGDMPLRQPGGVLIADADKLLLPFVCRPWRQGDWFVPLGMRGKKKVSDLFTDLKYTSFQKEAALMIVDTRTEGLAEQQHIAGVLGVRIDDRYKVTPQTKKIIRLTILNNTETL
jgi:tRNA(Ile)-lysidine synthase